MANTLIDETIYFGGPENITNALSRILYGTKKVRKDALPVNILISASTMLPGSELVSVLERLIDTNCRLLMIFIDVENNAKLSSFLANFAIVNVTNWDSLYKAIPDVVNYLFNVS